MRKSERLSLTINVAHVLAHAGKQGRRVISAFIAVAQNDAKAASQ
jgi:hypothetical protein